MSMKNWYVSINITSRWWYLGYDIDPVILFSERNGYQKVYRFRGFVFKYRKFEGE
jgi:hypothetical protein